MKTIGERLKWAREQRGLTQEQVAEAAGVSQSTIGNIEAGIRSSPRELLAIAAAVHARPQWLKDGKGSIWEFAAFGEEASAERVKRDAALADMLRDTATLREVARSLTKSRSDVDPEQQAEWLAALESLESDATGKRH